MKALPLFRGSRATRTKVASVHLWTGKERFQIDSDKTGYCPKQPGWSTHLLHCPSTSWSNCRLDSAELLPTHVMCPDIRMSQSALQMLTNSRRNQYTKYVMWNMGDNVVSCRYSPQGCSEVNLIHQGSHNGERGGLSITLGTTKYTVFFCS